MADSSSKMFGDIYMAVTGKKPVNSHRALGDVAMTCEVLIKFKEFIDKNYDKIIK